MKFESLGDRWNKFVVDARVPPHQQKEMKRAFYFGVGTLIDITEQVADLPDDVAYQQLERCREDTLGFLKLVMENRD
jgi:hypothetical protein